MRLNAGNGSWGSGGSATRRACGSALRGHRRSGPASAIVCAMLLLTSALVGVVGTAAAATPASPAVMPAAGVIATVAGGGPPDGVPAISVGLGPGGVVPAPGGGSF